MKKFSHKIKFYTDVANLFLFSLILMVMFFFVLKDSSSSFLISFLSTFVVLIFILYLIWKLGREY